MNRVRFMTASPGPSLLSWNLSPFGLASVRNAIGIANRMFAFRFPIPSFFLTRFSNIFLFALRATSSEHSFDYISRNAECYNGSIRETSGCVSLPYLLPPIYLLPLIVLGAPALSHWIFPLIRRTSDALLYIEE